VVENSSKYRKGMTDEELAEWAKNYKEPTRTVTTPRSLARNKKKKARLKASDAIASRKLYRNPENKKKIWGDEYNRRNRFLYHHNPEWRALKLYRDRFARFQKKRYLYDNWSVKYYTEYKDSMRDRAQTFKLEGTENYVLGFTVKELIKYSPIKKALLDSLYEANIVPPPKYRGYVFNDKSISKEPVEFYLVSEVESYLNVLAIYRKKYKVIHKEEQQAYLKGKFWTAMLKDRKKFDE
jgi:hypothetical protein